MEYTAIDEDVAMCDHRGILQSHDITKHLSKIRELKIKTKKLKIVFETFDRYIPITCDSNMPHRLQSATTNAPSKTYTCFERVMRVISYSSFSIS